MLRDALGLQGANPERDHADDVAADVEGPVLVNPVELMQAPEPVETGPVSSNARLRLADQKLRLPAQAPDLSRSRSVEADSVGEDRKLGLVGWRTVGMLDQGELPREMVQGGSVVEQHVTEYGSPFENWRVFQDFSSQHAFARAWVFVADDSERVLVEEPLDVLLEDPRVLIAPIQLREDTF